MLRWFPSFQVATTCFSCSPPDLNFLVTFFSYLCTCTHNHCHRVKTQLKLINIIILHTTSYKEDYRRELKPSRTTYRVIWWDSVWAILGGQDKNDGKLTSSLLCHYFCDYSLLLGFLCLFWIFFIFFSCRMYEGRSETKERFAIQRYLLTIGKK